MIERKENDDGEGEGEDEGRKSYELDRQIDRKVNG